MLVFSTGITGFVGGFALPELVRRGHRVRALVRSVSRAESRRAELAAIGLDPDALELCPGDLGSADDLTEALSGCDAVLHLAGLIAARDLAAFRTVNAEGTARLLDAALRQPAPPRFVLVSSLAAAGPSRPGAARLETEVEAPISWYGQSKREGELEALRRADRLRVAIARPPAVYGPGDRATLSFFKMARAGWAPFPGAPGIELSLIHAADLARGLVLLLEREVPTGRSYFFTGAGTPSFAEVIEVIARALGKRARVVRIPRFLANGVAFGSELYARLRGKAPELSRDKLRELAAPAWTCSGERARAELGFAPTIAWREGLEATAAWYRERGWI
ncbi:MAG: NAD-dependent epimerase/dehydratase family protein [Planctomycetes bacterium]|nr:NAD-dependent epimerase/dehydratase family protein [Planctomycetota bacterium]